MIRFLATAAATALDMVVARPLAWLGAYWLASRAFGLTLVWFSNDVATYFRAAESIMTGRVPYRDFVLEYPPAALPLFILPRLFTGSTAVYTWLFAGEMLALDALCVVILWRIARDAFGPRAGALIAALYLVCTSLLGELLNTHFDLAITALMLAWMRALLVKRSRVVTDVLLGLGVATKVVLVVLLPAYLGYLWAMHPSSSPGGWRAFTRWCMREVPMRIASVGVVVAAWMAPFVFVAGDAAFSWARYHAERGIQIESSYGLLLLLLHHVTGLPARVHFAFGAWEVEAWSPAIVGNLSTLVMGTTAVIVALLTVNLFVRERDRARLPLLLVGTSTAMFLCVTATAKVFSPQYLLWFVPGIAVLGVVAPRRAWVLALGAGIVLGTSVFSTFWYGRLVGMDAAVASWVAARNACVLALGVFVLRDLHEARGPAAG